MPESGPSPITDREFLIQIYEMLRHLDGLLAQHTAMLTQHTAQLDKLEAVTQKAEGGFVLVKFALAAVAPIGALAGWIGAKVI